MLKNNYTCRFFTFETYHGKKNIGSTRLRVHNLIKYWPEAGLYKYGENPDVLIFQKIYTQPDYKFPVHFEGIKILDICDPDWLIQQNIKETIDAMDGVTCPTKAMAEFLRQLTDKPVRAIEDRHDISLASKKTHKGTAKKVVWFGYKQNAEVLQFAIPSLERLGLELTVISNEDPQAFKWANNDYRSMYSFLKYDEDTIMDDLKRNDICVLPIGNRPQDRFKSNNKTTKAWLAGLPVAVDADGLKRFMDAKERQLEVDKKYEFAIENYDVQKSIIEVKDFISELSNGVSPLSGREQA